MILQLLMQPGSAIVACTGRFSGVKAANHYVETDLKTAPNQHRGHQTVANALARCIDGLLMMSIDDPAPIDAAWKRNYCVHRSIFGCKSSQPPPRNRSPNSTLSTP
jgi:hypothetical protein